MHHPSDPSRTITLTYADLSAFASGVMSITRLAETPGSGARVGLFGAGEFWIACPRPAPGVIGDNPEWNPITINGVQVGNRYGAESAYAGTFFTTQQSAQQSRPVAGIQLAIACAVEPRRGKEVSPCDAS